jgi:hypothetical protein
MICSYCANMPVFNKTHDYHDKKLLSYSFQEYIETQELFHNQCFRTINKPSRVYAYYFSRSGSTFL